MELRIRNGVIAAIQEYSSNDRERALVDFIILKSKISREAFLSLDKDAQVAILEGMAGLMVEIPVEKYEGIEELKVEAIVAPKVKKAPSIRKPRPKKEVEE